VAILDTFYILFKSDSKDAEKGIKRVNTSVQNLSSSLVATAAKGLSLIAVFKGLTSAFNYAFEVSQASQALQINAAELDVWGSALQKTGGTVSSLSSTLQNLADHLQTTPKIALEVLPKLAEQFEKLNQFESTRYGKILGLDTPTILLLQQGRREIDSLISRQKELGTVTQRDALVFSRFQSELQDTGHGIRSLTYEIGAAIIPTINILLHGIQDLSISLRKHSGFVKGVLLTLAAAATAAAIPFLVLNAAALLPVAALLALAAAVGLVWDDIQVFMKGGDSLIGRALERWPILGKVIQTTLGLIATAFKAVDSLFSKGVKEISVQANDVNLKKALKEIDIATSSGLGSQTSSSIYNSSNNRNQELNLTISDITIQTAATDAAGIAYGLKDELKKQFRQTQNDVAGGVLI